MNMHTCSFWLINMLFQRAVGKQINLPSDTIFCGQLFFKMAARTQQSILSLLELLILPVLQEEGCISGHCWPLAAIFVRRRYLKRWEGELLKIPPA